MQSERGNIQPPYSILHSLIFVQAWWICIPIGISIVGASIRGWTFLCWSEVPSYWCREKSRINIADSDSYNTCLLWRSWFLPWEFHEIESIIAYFRIVVKWGTFLTMIAVLRFSFCSLIYFSSVTNTFKYYCIGCAIHSLAISYTTNVYMKDHGRVQDIHLYKLPWEPWGYFELLKISLGHPWQFIKSLVLHVLYILNECKIWLKCG